MVKQIQVLAAPLLACALWSSAHAAEFDVGRATVIFSTEGWRETALPDTGLKYVGDRVGTLDVENKLLIKESPQHGIEAVVLLGSNRGLAGARMTYSRKCESTNGSFAEGASGDALRVAKCLRVFPMYTTSSLLADMGEAVQSALKGAEDKLPSGMYAITAEYWNTTGTALHAYVLLAPGIKTAPVPPDLVLPKGIDGGHVVWARELNQSLQDSVNSIFGKVAFPDVTFVAPADSNAAASTIGQPQ